ncbi:RNA-guided endonuclease TnpB family protein [Nonomuraea sp. NEAU-A123]|uniref:RNA-guided endonuclease TnpB family protein n=1 Tax=Nonomuraea sp. NEAU-A123 TaxID=2839649 RepID=UPI001BE490E3|nr:RNA-guided endonuclease TnpB family protein [Nonomuraea sp. NEAU-A123]MBT2231051.1 IS200/IS605 family accessory protein TnpB-related protein [Nonomuraea sp. NEAU-A123]
MAISRSATKRHGLPTVVQLRLTPTLAQAEALAAAVLLCNQAATVVSRLAWQHRTFAVVELHRLAYYEVRGQVAGLGAQAAVRAIARVSGAYANRRATKKRAHIFRPHGAIPYDARLMSWNRDARTVSLWTPTGRVAVPYAGRPEDLKAVDVLPVGEADLICRRGVWLLQVSLTMPKPRTREPVGGFVGVDQGVANLAVTCDGAVLPGPALAGPIGGNGHVRALRERRHRQRRRLQKKGTSAARRVLRRLAGREHRIMTDLNHQISKYVVREAERTGRGIALEDLQGIRGRVRAHRLQRRTLHNWAFAQQTTFTRYKAARAGVAFILVDTAYTS